MDMRRKILLEVAIQLLSLIGALSIHAVSHRIEITIAVTLALECFLHFFAFIWLYRHALDKILEWSNVDINPISEIEFIKSHIQDIRNNTIPMRYALASEHEWPFGLLIAKREEEFISDIKAISDGVSTIPMDDIPDVSVEVCDYMEAGAFCTALEENLEIFDTRKGEELLEKQCTTARRLADATSRDTGFTRLFIFDSLDRISKRHLEIMRLNKDSRIEVLVAERKGVAGIFRRYALENRMDFGRWKGNLLMEIIGRERSNRYLHITRKSDDIRIIDSLIKDLREAAWDYDMFVKHFVRPMNVSIWSTQPQESLRLDVPDGPHDLDCRTMFRFLSTAKSEANIAIFGLTQLLMDHAESLMDDVAHTIRSVDVIDARPYAPPRRSKINFLCKNWLEKFGDDGRYDFIVGDDVLCNLTLWQTPMFFENVARSLADDGLFVCRTTGIFSPGTANPSWEEIVEEFRKFDGKPGDVDARLTLSLLSPGAVYEMAWPTLHTSQFYHEESRQISFGAWNEAVMKSDTNFSADLRNRLRFRRSLKLSSVPYEELQEAWAPYLNAVQAPLPAISRWEVDTGLAQYPRAAEVSARFHEYYKILVLRRAVSG